MLERYAHFFFCLFQQVLYSTGNKEGTKLTTIQKYMHVTKTLGNTIELLVLAIKN